MPALGLDLRCPGTGGSEEHPAAGSWGTSANPFLRPSPVPWTDGPRAGPGVYGQRGVPGALGWGGAWRGRL